MPGTCAVPLIFLWWQGVPAYYSLMSCLKIRIYFIYFEDAEITLSLIKGGWRLHSPATAVSTSLASVSFAKMLAGKYFSILKRFSRLIDRSTWMRSLARHLDFPTSGRLICCLPFEKLVNLSFTPIGKQSPIVKPLLARISSPGVRNFVKPLSHVMNRLLARPPYGLEMNITNPLGAMTCSTLAVLCDL